MNLQKTGTNNSKINNSTNRLTIVLFIIYLIALTWILLFKLGVRFSYMRNMRVSLIPFREFLFLHGRMNAGDIISNVVIFVPLGIYAAVLFERWIFWKKLFFIFLISFLVEALQFILAIGAFDITDIITNTAGGIIGIMIFKAIEKAFNNSVNAQKFINWIAAIGTVTMIILLLLLKMDMLPIRYR